MRSFVIFLSLNSIPSCFKSGICLLFAPVPVHCFSIIFDMELLFYLSLELPQSEVGESQGKQLGQEMGYEFSMCQMQPDASDKKTVY